VLETVGGFFNVEGEKATPDNTRLYFNSCAFNICAKSQCIGARAIQCVMPFVSAPTAI